jgi:hypothetical protein
MPSWVDSRQYQFQAKAPVTFRFSLELKDRMQVDQILRSQEGHRLGGKVCARGEKRIEGSEILTCRVSVAAVYIRP